MLKHLSIILGLPAANFTGTAYAQDLPLQLSGLTEEQLTQTMTFVGGNARFVLLHESGHMLISELNLPVMSSEEDAVDTLSTLVLLNNPDPDLQQALWSASAGWMMAGDESAVTGDTPPYWDVHGLDKQRGYNIVCLMYGSDPNKYLLSANAFNLPDARRAGCGREYEKLSTSWDNILSPYTVNGERPSPFTVTYEPTDNAELAYYAKYARENDLLGLVDKMLTSFFPLNPGIRLTAKECGMVNAFWAPENRELTLCYELMYWHANLVTKRLR